MEEKWDPEVLSDEGVVMEKDQGEDELGEGLKKARNRVNETNVTTNA